MASWAAVASWDAVTQPASFIWSAGSTDGTWGTGALVGTDDSGLDAMAVGSQVPLMMRAGGRAARKVQRQRLRRRRGDLRGRDTGPIEHELVRGQGRWRVSRVAGDGDAGKTGNERRHDDRDG